MVSVISLPKCTIFYIEKNVKGKCMTFQLQDLNAQLIQNAPITLHAYKKSVKTLAILTRVVEMQNVRQKIIEQFVFVFMDMLEILTPCVKSVS